MIKLLHIVGNRPQFIKLAPFLEATNKYKDIKNIIVHSGQHYDYEMSKIFFKELGIPSVNYNLETGSGTHGSQTGKILIKLDSILSKEQPSVVVVYGDTNTTLAGALAAYKLHFPVAHVESGMREYMWRPEEINKKIADHCADFCFCPLERACQNLQNEGIPSERIYFTGDITFDAFLMNKTIANEKTSLELPDSDYIFMTMHRAETVDIYDRVNGIIEALPQIPMRIIYPMHPRTKKRLIEMELYNKLKDASNIDVIDPVGYFESIKLMINSKIVITDSGGVIKEAFYIARSGRPGPVLIDIPKDLAIAKVPYKVKKKVGLKSYKPTYEPNKKQLKKVVELIKKARKPVIFTGGGVIISGAAKNLTEFAHQTRIPVTGSLMGLGGFPGTDPLWLGMLGMHGTYRANMAVSECDLMIAVGVRFDDRVTGKTDEFAANATIIQIDIDPTSIHKNIPVSVPVVGDCNITLGYLNDLIKKENSEDIKKKREKWLGQIEEWKETTPLVYKQKDNIKPQYVIEKLFEITKGKAIITTEVGQNQMWAAQYYHFDKPGHFITSGGLGCMGFGLPAAIGAQKACPDAIVVDIAGDGSIQMNIQEMATAVQYGLPVKVVILNNRFLGMVRQWQELFYDKLYSSTHLDHNPDFVKLAEAYGALGLRATKPEEVEKILAQGMAHNGPVIMDFVVENEENVYPMVPAGAPITQMLLV